MTYTRPFVTPRFTAHEGDSWRRLLSLAVQVFDAFTGEMAAVPLRVRLKELPSVPARRNLGGLYCFEGGRPGQPIPPGTYTLAVEPDATTADFFFLRPLAPGDPWTDTFEREITLPITGPLAPLVVVTLSPKASYPFPGNATLVRGTVTQGSPAAAVAGAVVSTTYEQVDPEDTSSTVLVDVETQTDRAGEYALFFKGLPARTQTVTLLAAKGVASDPLDVEITEGETLAAAPLELP